MKIGYVSNDIFQTADERTSYHLLYFIAMDIVKNHKCNNKEDNKWMVFDQFCNEFATDDRDTEHTEIQLLMSLRKVFSLYAHAFSFRKFGLLGRRLITEKYNERS